MNHMFWKHGVVISDPEAEPARKVWEGDIILSCFPSVSTSRSALCIS